MLKATIFVISPLASLALVVALGWPALATWLALVFATLAFSTASRSDSIDFDLESPTSTMATPL